MKKRFFLSLLCAYTAAAFGYPPRGTMHDIELDFMYIFTVLDKCCIDLDNTITKCCQTLEQDFAFTWTMLVAIAADTSGVFTVLEECCTDLNLSVSDCCQTIEEDFAYTWTMIDALARNSCRTAGFTQADFDANGGFIDITEPGNYILLEDIVAAGGGSVAPSTPGAAIINIISSDVTLDLCGRNITAVSPSASLGIYVGTTENVNVLNGSIHSCFTGIVVNGSCRNLSFDSISTYSNLVTGLQFGTNGFPDFDNTETTSIVIINNCRVFDNSKAFPITECNVPRFTLLGSPNLIINNAETFVIQNSFFNEAITNRAYGGFLTDCFNFKVFNCSFNSNLGSESATGLFLSRCSDNFFSQCQFNYNGTCDSAAGLSSGILMSNSKRNIFQNCQLSSNISLAGDSYGMRSVNGKENNYNNCIASNNIAAGNGCGFGLSNEQHSSFIECQSTGNSGEFCEGYLALTGTGNVFDHCQAIDNSATSTSAGFRFGNETNSTIKNCLSNVNTTTGSPSSSFGILLEDNSFGGFGGSPSARNYIQANSLSENSSSSLSWGILDTATASTNFAASNFAFNHAINFGVTYASGPLPTVSGSFSGGLPATGTTGSFDNIGINV